MLAPLLNLCGHYPGYQFGLGATKASGRREGDARCGQALLWTLEQGLAAEFRPEVRSAWASVYVVIATTMQAGAAEASH